MTNRLTVANHLAPTHRALSLARDARAGLLSTPKTLSPVWFYDERGSLLFDEITRLPEYYLTRAERAILTVHAFEIAAVSQAQTLVELGSGTSEKTRLLLDALQAAGTLQRFVPFDVSEEVLRDAAEKISTAYRIPVDAVVGDFNQHLDRIPEGGRRLVAFLGSTIGNLTPSERRRFLFDLDAVLTIDDRLLIGTDLIKDPARLVAAYDDSAGVTAAFNRNLLEVLNRELDATFDPSSFDHVAVWNSAEGWIEMRLRSRLRQSIPVPKLGIRVDFAAGEDLLTEISAKFTPDQVERELWAAGFVTEKCWTDPEGDFLLTLARPYC
jgi:L-histidine N-alpha-methyltransferase